MAKREQPARGWVKQDDRLFTLEVYIISGPMTEKFAKKNKVEVIVGSTHEVQVKHETKVGFPGKNDEGREELEAIIRKAGKWDEVADLSTGQLKQIVADEAWPKALLKAVRKFETVEETESVRLRKRKDGENDI